MLIQLLHKIKATILGLLVLILTVQSGIRNLFSSKELFQSSQIIQDLMDVQTITQTRMRKEKAMFTPTVHHSVDLVTQIQY